MEEKRFFDVPGLAKYIYMSKSTIYKMVSNQTIPHIKIGTPTLFDREQIDNWVINGGGMEDNFPSFPSV